jgi:hypothetical protein
MFPDDILNCIASIALVVLKYPETKPSFAPVADTDDLEIKCLTKVVSLGLNKCKVPEELSSALVLKLSASLKYEVDCAKSFPATYDKRYC